MRATLNEQQRQIDEHSRQMAETEGELRRQLTEKDSEHRREMILKDGDNARLRQVGSPA